jgi:hypothetical protein
MYNVTMNLYRPSIDRCHAHSCIVCDGGGGDDVAG